MRSYSNAWFGLGLALATSWACSGTDPQAPLPRASASSFAQDRTPSQLPIVSEVTPDPVEPIEPQENEAPLEEETRTRAEIRCDSNPYCVERRELESMLSRYCGECHGSQLSVEEASASLNYIDDIEDLLAEGVLIAGSSEQSLVVRLMEDGDMPPPFAAGERPTQEDIDLLADFLDTPVF